MQQRQKNVAQTDTSPSSGDQRAGKLCLAMDEFYRHIHARYEDTVTLSSLLAKARVQSLPRCITLLLAHQLAINEVERREDARRQAEKELLTLVLKTVGTKGCDQDRVTQHLRKMLKKVVQQSARPRFYAKTSLSKTVSQFHAAVHLSCVVGTPQIADLIPDEILGGFFEDDVFLTTPARQRPILTLLENYAEGNPKVALYPVFYHAVLESRVRLDDYLSLYYGYVNESQACVLYQSKTDAVLAILSKLNSETARNVAEYSTQYGLRKEAREKRQCLPQCEPGSEDRAEKVLRLLQSELEPHVDTVIGKKEMPRVSLGEIVAGPPQMALEPSARIVEAYVKKKRQAQMYISHLEEDYKMVEGAKHVRRCLLLHCIVCIQRLFRTFRLTRRSKAATRIQRAYRKRFVSKKRRTVIITRVRSFVLSYRLRRWLRLAIKVRRLRKRFAKESVGILARMQGIAVPKLVKCQALVRRFLVRIRLPLLRLQSAARAGRRSKSERLRLMGMTRTTASLDREMLGIKLSAQEEISRGGCYLQTQRAKFEEAWKEYAKGLEKESKRTNAKHMQNWVSQRDKYGNMFWLNVKTMAQQPTHPGKDWLRRRKESLFAEAMASFEAAMLPLLTNLSKIKEQSKVAVGALIVQRDRAVSEFLKSNKAKK